VAADALEKLMRAWAGDCGTDLQISVYAAAEGFLDSLREGKAYDAAFLDIHLRSKIDGMDIAQAIRQRRDEMIIVFVTSFMDYVLRGYEVRALRYLIKPAKRRDLYACLDAVTATLKSRDEQSYYWKAAGTDARLRFRDILYFEIFSHTASLHAVDGAVFEFAKRLIDLESELPAFFVRCHRSYIVNIHHVFALKKNTVELDSTLELPVSQRRRQAVHEAFVRYRM